MYQLYYYPLNASMAPHFILEALNVDFELITVDRKNNGQKSPEYLALNPAGRVPTLVDDGQVIFESPAICVYLAEAHPPSNLIPKVGDKNRALFFQWMMYLTNTLQAELMIYYYPEKYTTDINGAQAIRDAQQTRLLAVLELLDNELANKAFLVGNAITACDYFLFMLCVWSDELNRPPLSWPNLSQYLGALAQRDEVIEVCKKEGFSLVDYSF